MGLWTKWFHQAHWYAYKLPLWSWMATRADYIRVHFFPMASQQRGARSWSPWAMAQNSAVHKLRPRFSEPCLKTHEVFYSMLARQPSSLCSSVQEFITRLKLGMKPCWVRVNCAYSSFLTSTSSSSPRPPSLL